jgi:peptide methionine sulfoxide reductase msrA/msrB
MKTHYFILFVALVFLFACTAGQNPSLNRIRTEKAEAIQENSMTKKIQKSEEEWKESLTEDQFCVLRQGGTERAFTGEYNDYYEEGTYLCAACQTPLFSSETKYDHGTGWPSFISPIDDNRITYHEDLSYGMRRTEVRCASCGSHLGHVFNDGPAPEKTHYCINSVSLDFKEKSAGGEKKEPAAAQETESQKATFAAGCFWGVEHKFRQINGVVSTRVGYAGGHVKNPTYRQVCNGNTRHAEAVEITFDPAVLSYSDLLETFFTLHDPTQKNRQGPDIGEQYRSAIFYHDEAQKQSALKAIEKIETSKHFRRSIATQVLPAPEFYEAEKYHQQYYEKLKK